MVCFHFVSDRALMKSGYRTNPLPLMKFPIHYVKQAQINVPFDGRLSDVTIFQR